MFSEQILEYEKRIEWIDEELENLKSSLDRLDIAEVDTAGSITGIGDMQMYLMGAVKKAYERGSHLGIMQMYLAEMEQLIAGNSFQRMSQSVNDVNVEIQKERENCEEQIRNLENERCLCVEERHRLIQLEEMNSV